MGHTVFGVMKRSRGYESFQGRVWGEFGWTKRKTRGTHVAQETKSTLYHGGPILGC